MIRTQHPQEQDEIFLLCMQVWNFPATMEVLTRTTNSRRFSGQPLGRAIPASSRQEGPTGMKQEIPASSLLRQKLLVSDQTWHHFHSSQLHPSLSYTLHQLLPWQPSRAKRPLCFSFPHLQAETTSVLVMSASVQRD